MLLYSFSFTQRQYEVITASSFVLDTVKYTNKKFLRYMYFVLRVCASYHSNVHFTNVKFWTTNNINPCASLKQIRVYIHTHTYTHMYMCRCSSPYNTTHILQNENSTCMYVSFYLYYILPLIKYFYKLCFCFSFPYLIHFSLGITHSNTNTDQTHNLLLHFTYLIILCLLYNLNIPLYVYEWMYGET